MNWLNKQLLLLSVFVLVACVEQVNPNPPLPNVKKPLPISTSVDSLSPQKNGSVSGQTQKTKLLAGPRQLRFDTPGRVRWVMDLDSPISFIRWSPLKGLVVSSGNKVWNITSVGEQRWSYIAGEGHQLFVVQGEEILWSPQFSLITQLQRWGRRGVVRKWHADLVSDGKGAFFLVDAATISAMGPDGKDRWRLSLEGVRRLEGPFLCDQGALFQGIKGKESVAVAISDRGAVVSETQLERNSVLVGAAGDCSPLVWSGSAVVLLDFRGVSKWQKEIYAQPQVNRLDNGFLLAVSEPKKPITLLALKENGNLAWETNLSVKGRFNNFSITTNGDFSVGAIGLCLDVSSPCARVGQTRGPFNTLFVQNGPGKFGLLMRHVKGHLKFVKYPGGGIVTASSAQPDWVELVRRDAFGAVVWSVELPGRLSAGPHVGPWGEVYVGTCKEWDCAPPYKLYAVTGKPPEKEKDDSASSGGTRNRRSDIKETATQASQPSDLLNLSNPLGQAEQPTPNGQAKSNTQGAPNAQSSQSLPAGQ